MQNTSLTPDDIGELSIPKIEALFDAFEECNKNDGSPKSKDRLEDKDALRFLIDSGGKL